MSEDEVLPRPDNRTPVQREFDQAIYQWLLWEAERLEREAKASHDT